MIASSPARLRNRAAAMARQPAGTRQSVARHARSRVKRLALALALLVAFGIPTAGAGAATHAIALFPTASSPNWAGFARIINHSDESGTVRIVGIDDAGRESGPIELSLEAKATAHFNSADLEEGNADKGLSQGLGAGEGDWRLRFESELAIEVLSYIRTGDGFVTAMHEVVPVQARGYHVRFFNPGSNTSQVSRLRLVNPTGDEVEVSIEGRDDDGEPAPGGAARLMIAPGEARTLTAQALEWGGAELARGLGDGTGKWQLFITVDAAIEVMNLLESPTGHLSNLSAPGLRDVSEGRRAQELALFMPVSDEAREGFARLLNHSEESGTVRIYGIDDEGEWSGPVTLSLEAGAAAHFNSRDLERGNAEKGLSGALGVGSGNWRLRLYTELDLESLAYVRTGDGFVTTMHERVRESAMRHHVAFFNPGSNRSQVSRLRLINPTEEDVEVTIAGRDDDGAAAPGGEVSLTLGPGEARMLTAQELEEGGAGLAGSLGDGSGKWQLFVSADGPIEVMNLLRSPTGHLANLSASSQEGVRPTFRDCAECPQMVVVPAGSYRMGLSVAEAVGVGGGALDATPDHVVTIAEPFAVGAHEVTKGEWSVFVSEGGYRGSGYCFTPPRDDTRRIGLVWDFDARWDRPGFEQDDAHPAVCVSWLGAREYVEWLSDRTGEDYRLLSESEWEYAARGGRSTSSRHWYEHSSQACVHANARDRSTNDAYPLWAGRPFHDCRDGRVYTAPVASFAPNGYGLYDMLGNAREWTGDCWSSSYRGVPADGSARGGCSYSFGDKVIRGGSWYGKPREVQLWYRGDEAVSSAQLATLGFRVARTVD